MNKLPTVDEARAGSRLLAYVYHWTPVVIGNLGLDSFAFWTRAARSTLKGTI